MVAKAPAPSPRLGQRLRRTRDARGVSQSSLARRTGIPQPAISRIETGREVPSFDRYQRLLAGPGLTMEVDLALLKSHTGDPRHFPAIKRMTPGERLEQAANWQRFAAELRGKAAGGARGASTPPEPGSRRTLGDRKLADPSAIVATLNRFEVRFIVIGAVAGVALGLQRITRDFDILIEPSAKNCRRAIAALADLHAEEFHPATKEWARVHSRARPGWLLRKPRFFDSDAGGIAICNPIESVPDWDTAYRGSTEIQAFDERFRVLDKDAFIRSKLAAGREKDLEDVAELNELDQET
jgi:transcriptional regulator with XRE-family HTH domain